MRVHCHCERAQRWVGFRISRDMSAARAQGIWVFGRRPSRQNGSSPFRIGRLYLVKVTEQWWQPQLRPWCDLGATPLILTARERTGLCPRLPLKRQNCTSRSPISTLTFFMASSPGSNGMHLSRHPTLLNNIYHVKF